MAVSQPCLLLTPNLCPPFLSMTAVTSAGPCSPNDGFQSILSLATLTLTWLFLYPTSITLPSWCGGMGQALGWAGGAMENKQTSLISDSQGPRESAWEQNRSVGTTPHHRY